VKVFRIDNPHTKPFPFWEWLIAEVHQVDRDVIFLSEAFTRRAVMRELAKLGFTQSYTYFTWKNSRHEMIEYFDELAVMVDTFRPLELGEGGRAADDGTLGPGDVALIEQVTSRITDLAGPDEPPSRIHGDCWSGNLLWSGGRGWLIDPAAHGGHRETDLAMLALFGAPHLNDIVRGYHETVPLADGWRARIPLHQLHPLLVHVVLFGAGYREPALAAARDALAA